MSTILAFSGASQKLSLFGNLRLLKNKQPFLELWSYQAPDFTKNGCLKSLKTHLFGTIRQNSNKNR